MFFRTAKDQEITLNICYRQNLTDNQNQAPNRDWEVELTTIIQNTIKGKTEQFKSCLSETNPVNWRDFEKPKMG